LLHALNDAVTCYIHSITVALLTVFSVIQIVLRVRYISSLTIKATFLSSHRTLSWCCIFVNWLFTCFELCRHSLCSQYYHCYFTICHSFEQC